MSARLDNVEDIYELSALQQAVLHRALQNPSGALQRQWIYRTNGLDIPAFLRACQLVIDRHAILRTAFHHEGLKKPVQVVRRRALLQVEQLDWTGLTPAEQAARFSDYRKASRLRPFDLTAPPLLRLALIRIGESDHQHVWDYHPLLMDGWSRSLFFEEVFSCYSALCEGREFQPPARLPFRDYIVWQQRQDRAAAEAFWREWLRGFPTPLVLRKSSAGGVVKQRKLSVQRVRFSPVLASALKSLEREQGLPLGTMILAAWALVLARHLGREDVLFGATVQGRPADLPGVEGAIGLFVNTLPIRVRLSADRPLLGWVKELHARMEETRRFDYLPLEQLKSWSETPPGQRMFESLVASEQDPVGRSDSPWRRGVKIDPLRRSARHGGYPLVGMLGGSGRTFRIAYSRDSIEPGTARVMLRGLRSVLAGLITAPEQKLKRLLKPQRIRRTARTVVEETAVDNLLGLCLAIFQNQEGEATSSVLVPLQTRGAKPPIFCFHPAGATTRCYRSLARFLGADQPAYGVQPLPERGPDEPAPSLQEMADHCLVAMQSVQPQGPYILAGWSVGGAVAFVTAQRLLERGEKVGLLALMEASVPDKEAARRGLEGRRPATSASWGWTSRWTST
jgi:hypothetical protein